MTKFVWISQGQAAGRRELRDKLNCKQALVKLIFLNKIKIA